MFFYQRIRDLREDKDEKQETIAKILSITRSQYQLYESGKRQIPFNLVIELAKFYNVSIDYIAGLTNDKQKHWNNNAADAESSITLDSQLLHIFSQLPAKRKQEELARMKYLVKYLESENKKL